MTFIISWVEIGLEKTLKETGLLANQQLPYKKSLLLWDFKSNKIYEQALDMKWNSWQCALVYKNKC